MLEEIWEKYQKQIIITGITVPIVVMFFCILVGAGRNDSTDKMIGNNLTSSSSSTQSSSNSATQMASGQDKETHAQRLASSKIMVDVKGAVKSPGVYEVKSGMRIMDAIEIAGGMTKSADQRNINLATQLSDQQVVYVPIKGEIKNSDPSQLSAVGSSSISSSSPSTTDSSTEKIVNINTASKAELLT
ncbi:SLBB domain-containing protein [Pediococcus pentosaceus]|uniref:SLBB domain-containing protein n=1 Tax=Pediococcus pentosaceus TaxID=1255 RepID=UPI001E589917|nr:SLBB domain-containing protein [Pediococcus pentosaceus]MCM6810064.1 SLBB domain-containing protein [Pediococcus pentosaceus]MCM6811590.1 SLBB domain-containing protein [Pediococcus pentosaceus]MDN3207583.1 SLBB domain-containing protein [Pediococcus pentosaceus]